MAQWLRVPAVLLEGLGSFPVRWLTSGIPSPECQTLDWPPQAHALKISWFQSSTSLLSKEDVVSKREGFLLMD